MTEKTDPRIADMFLQEFRKAQSMIESKLFAEAPGNIGELTIFDEIRHEIGDAILRAMAKERCIRTAHKF